MPRLARPWSTNRRSPARAYKSRGAESTRSKDSYGSSSASSSTRDTASSSSTIPGIGSVGGHVVKSIGEFAIAIGKRAEIEYALTRMRGIFPHSGARPQDPNEVAYDTLLDLTRSDCYPPRICLVALALVYGQIQTGQTNVLVTCVAKLGPHYASHFLADVAEAEHNLRVARNNHAIRTVTLAYLNFLQAIARTARDFYDVAVERGAAYVSSSADPADASRFCWHHMYILSAMRLAGIDTHSVDVLSENVRFKWLLRGEQNVGDRLDDIALLLKELWVLGDVDEHAAVRIPSTAQVRNLVADLIEFTRVHYGQRYPTVPRRAYEMILLVIVIGEDFWPALASLLASSLDSQYSIIGRIIHDSTDGDPFVESTLPLLRVYNTTLPKDRFLEFFNFLADRFPDIEMEASEWGINKFILQNISGFEAARPPASRDLWARAKLRYVDRMVWGLERFGPSTPHDAVPPRTGYDTIQIHVKVSTEVMEE